MAEDISLRATGDTGDLERTFEGAEESVRRSMEAARDAVESLDVSQVGIFKLEWRASRGETEARQREMSEGPDSTYEAPRSGGQGITSSISSIEPA